MSEPAIVARSVTKRLGGITALDAISLTIARGQLVGIIGWNGAGKTTLLRLFVGLIAPDAGSLHVLGHDAARVRGDVQALVGYVPQSLGLDDFLTVGESVRLRAELRGTPDRRLPATVGDALAATGLLDAAAKRASELNEEERRRLALANALVGAPPLLLLDEPTHGLDSAARRAFVGMVRALAMRGATVLLTSSSVDDVRRCDAVILLEKGRVVFHGTPSELVARAEGRTRAVAVTGRSRRIAAVSLRAAPGILQADIDRDSVRIVTGRAGTAPAEDKPSHSTAPVSPRLEEGVVVSLLDADPEYRPPAGPHIEARARPGRAALEVRELSKRFGGRRVVDRLSFVVEPGEVFGIAGPNGSGKSTVLKMLGGALPVSAGEIRVDGIDLLSAPAEASVRLGWAGPGFSLHGNLTVRQNLQFLASLQRSKRERPGGQVERVAAQCDLETVLETRAGLLPRPVKRRLMLAAALLNEPVVLLVDDPSSGADPLTVHDMWQRIDALAAGGFAVVVGSHLVEDVRRCDRALVLGRQGPPPIITPEQGGTAMEWAREEGVAAVGSLSAVTRDRDHGDVP